MLTSYISVPRVVDDGKVVYVRIPLEEAFAGTTSLNMTQFDLTCKMKNTNLISGEIK